MKRQRNQNNFEKQELGANNLLSFKTYYIATVIKTVQYWQTEQWKTIENPEMPRFQGIETQTDMPDRLFKKVQR